MRSARILLRARQAPRWIAIAGVAAALGGCAGVPESGSVHVGRALPAGSGVEANEIRVIASAPIPGMSPGRLVSGFLNALVDSDGNYAVARLYLAPGAVWHPVTGTTVYDGGPTVRVRGVHSVDVAVPRVGTIDPRGNFRVAPGTLHTRFTVVRSDGQWRISHLTAEILLSASDADRTFQTAMIYFFNRAQTRLVPEPVLVPPDAPGLATTLIRELVDGPNRSLAPAVANAVPPGTVLVGNVPIGSDGVAEVDLAGSVQQVSAAELERLSAQIVWTLRQVTSVTAVRLLINGAPLSVAGVATVQPIGSWPQFDPESPPTSHGALLSDGGRIVGLGTSVPTALAGKDLVAPVISADGTVVAALHRKRHRTTLVEGAAAGGLRARLSGASLTSPAFDPQGDVIVVSGVGARSRLVEVPPVGAARPVTVSASIRHEGISQVAISRDGSRIAMVVGPPGHQALAVGAVAVTHGAIAIDSIYLVIPGAADVSGVAWSGANAIATTVRESRNHRVVELTGADGYEPHAVGGASLPRDPTQVAASPGQRMLAVVGGAVWMLSEARWQQVSLGQDPSYAG